MSNNQFEHLSPVVASLALTPLATGDPLRVRSFRVIADPGNTERVFWGGPDLDPVSNKFSGFVDADQTDGFGHENDSEKHEFIDLTKTFVRTAVAPTGTNTVIITYVKD